MTPEKKVEEYIKKQLNKKDAYWVKTWGGTYSKKGVPDMLCCYHQQFIALELKRPIGGKPTPVQIKNLYQIATNHGLALLTNDPHVDQQIDAYLNHQTPQHWHQVTLSASDLKTITPEKAANYWHQFEKDDPTRTVQILSKGV